MSDLSQHISAETWTEQQTLSTVFLKSTNKLLFKNCSFKNSNHSLIVQKYDALGQVIFIQKKR